jgi:hypothetical protein
MGEWNIMGNTPSDPRQQRIQGAVFAMLAIHTAFTNDPLTRYGSIWDWLGDDYYGLIIDPNNATSMSTRMPAYSVVPAGYALKLGRQFMGGDVVRSSRQSGNIRFLATSNDTRASLLIINFDTSTTFSGSIGLSRWPANSTGRGTANLWQLSPSHPTPHDTGLTVTNGVIPSIRIPAMSITVITIGG